MAGGALVVSGAFVALLAQPHARSGAATTTTTDPAASAVTTPEVTAPGVTEAPPVTGAPTTTLDPLGGTSIDGGGSAAPLNPPVQVPRSSSRSSQVSSGAS